MQSLPLPPDRLIIVVLFLGALCVLWWFVTRNRVALTKQIAGDRRMKLCEVMPLGGGARMALVEVDGKPLCIVTNGKTTPALVPLTQEGAQ